MYVKRRKLISNIILIFVNISLFLYIAQNYSKQEVYKKSKYCKPRRRIGFLKTHKCASSSITNILLRYVMNNDLNVVLRENDNYIGYRAQFNRKLIANTSWEKAHLKYDMFLCHTRWNHSEISSVLSDDGKNDVFIFQFYVIRLSSIDLIGTIIIWQNSTSQISIHLPKQWLIILLNTKVNIRTKGLTPLTKC